MTSIKKVTIYGERCSGTNYLENLILLNFDASITWEYGWKHFFGHSDLSNSDDTLFICITRNPVDWLNSLYLTPHHLHYDKKYNVDTFLNSTIVSFDEETEQEITDDHHIEEKRKYNNIFELRHIKMKYMINILPTLVKNYILIRYEDLLNDFDKTMNNIKNMGLCAKSGFPINSMLYKNTNIPFDINNKKPKYISLREIYKHPSFNPYYEIKLGYY
jgi:hypothetical protein